MIIIGLCGSSGSGKGYVCEKFSRYAVGFIDTDLVYRERVLVNRDCVNELVNSFGSGILDNGGVSKKRLAAIVFEGQGAKERLNILNRITHKYIKTETEALISSYKKRGYFAVLIDAPVLFESGFDKMCDVTICVTAPYEEKLERIMKRDGISYEKAVARLNSQLSDDVLRKKCTFELVNKNGADLDGQIHSVLKSLDIIINA